MDGSCVTWLHYNLKVPSPGILHFPRIKTQNANVVHMCFSPPHLVSMSLSLSLRKWATKSTKSLLSALPFLVFLSLDFLDVLACFVYRFLDEYLEGKSCPPCYCEKKGDQLVGNDVGDGKGSLVLSETLYERENVFRKMGFFGFGRKREDSVKGSIVGGGKAGTVWSDCGCEECVSWMKSNGDLKLHVVVREPSRADFPGDSAENVIFLHGFLCSSLYWTETVFPNLTGPIKQNYKLFAVDLLGFGKSPKPRDCLYTLRDHVEMIENSVVNPYGLKSFHLVAHSMGCIIALALAAKFPACVKSITLVAPPCIPSSKEEASLAVLQKIAGKRLWPPLLFCTAFMSWYEHLGRCVCLLVCRNHRIWERILKLLTWKRDLHFMLTDTPKHTHHSAWHSMHNVICGGAKQLDDFFEILIKFGVKICVIQGNRDIVVPMECIHFIKKKFPSAEVSIVENAEHDTVIIGREKEFVQHLEHIWASSSETDSLAHEST